MLELSDVHVRLVTSDITSLVHDAVFINSFSEMAHIYALSAVLNVPIRSYYHPELSSEVFTRRVVGRDVRDSKCGVVLMWTVVNFDPCRYIYSKSLCAHCR